MEIWSSSFLDSDGVENFSSTTARMGPGGIAEIQRQARDFLVMYSIESIVGARISIGT